MRDHVHSLQRLHELGRVIPLSAPSVTWASAAAACTASAIIALAASRSAKPSARVTRADGDQSVPIVAERVPDVTQLAGRVAFAIQSGIWIARGGVRVDAAWLATEVTAIAVILVILEHEALVACPSLDQRAIDAEVLAKWQYRKELDKGMAFMEAKYA